MYRENKNVTSDISIYIYMQVHLCFFHRYLSIVLLQHQRAQLRRTKDPAGLTLGCQLDKVHISASMGQFTSTVQPSAPRMQSNSERMAGCDVNLTHQELPYSCTEHSLTRLSQVIFTN